MRLMRRLPRPSSCSEMSGASSAASWRRAASTSGRVTGKPV